MYCNQELDKNIFLSAPNDFHECDVLPAIAVVIGSGPGVIRYLNEAPVAYV